MGHRHIRRAEIDGPHGKLANAATRSDRLIIDLNRRVTILELLEPFLVNRGRECSSGRVEVCRRGRAGERGKPQRGETCDPDFTHLIHSSCLSLKCFSSVTCALRQKGTTGCRSEGRRTPYGCSRSAYRRSWLLHTRDCG